MINYGMMLTESASAQGGVGSSIAIIIMYIALFIVFGYFLIVRPQKKQSKAMLELHNSMEPGDSVMTTGGFYGTLLDVVDETTVIVEFGNNKNCRIPMHVKAIAEVEKAGSAVEKEEE